MRAGSNSFGPHLFASTCPDISRLFKTFKFYELVKSQENRHCERSEAILWFASVRQDLDCFLTPFLAMTHLETFHEGVISI
jgi:hypothetical protein